MNTTYSSFKIMRLALFIFGVATFILPMAALGMGEGGGGYSGGGFGQSVDLGGRTMTAIGNVTVTSGSERAATVTSVTQTDGILSGTYQGQTVSFNNATGQWEGTDSGVGTGTGSGNDYTATCTENCSTPPPEPTNVTVTQSCSNTNVQTTISNNNDNGPYDNQDTLYLNDSSYGSIGGPGSKTVTLPPNTNYNGRIESTTWYWDTANPSWPHWQDTQRTYNFSFRTLNCAPPAPAVNLVANPSVVDYNKSSTLSWSSQNATACTASSNWSGFYNGNLNDSNGVSTGPLTADTTFSLTCQGQSGTTPARDQETVTVRVGVDADIDTDDTVVRKNDQVKLDWDVGTSLPENCVVKAGSITIDGPFTSNSGSTYHDVSGETEFSISCDGGQNADSITVKVLPEFQET